MANLSCVKSEENYVAHGLVKVAVTHVIYQVWLEEISKSVYDIVIGE